MLTKNIGAKNFAHVDSGLVKLFAIAACQQEQSGWNTSRQLTARMASGKCLLNDDMVDQQIDISTAEHNVLIMTGVCVYVCVRLIII